MTLSGVRRDYQGDPLDEQAADADPFRQFGIWFDEARVREADPTAMALATAGAGGQPSVRMVLLKGLDARGFVFFTNYTSRKGRELDENARVSLLFYWSTLTRQVRIEGGVERIAADESDAYFASRPADSRIAALVSPQSQVVESRASLEARFAETLARFPAADMPRPPFWGGYLVVPSAFEFWQGRPGRLHDRLRYDRAGSAGWTRVRLAP